MALLRKITDRGTRGIIASNKVATSKSLGAYTPSVSATLRGKGGGTAACKAPIPVCLIAFLVFTLGERNDDGH